MIRTQAKTKLVVFVGVSGFPVGLAAIQRQTLLAKSLLREGWNVIVVNTRSTHPQTSHLRRTGNFEGIKYIYLFDPHRPDGFVKRNFQKIVSPFLELLLLINLNRRYGISIGLVSHRNSMVGACKYFLFSIFLRFKLIINLVEIYGGRQGMTTSQKVNDVIFNRIGLYFYDAYLPISHKIVDYFKTFRKPFYLVPVIADTASISAVPKDVNSPSFFLFCGAAAYQRSIEFILAAFVMLKMNAELVLVINGSAAEIARIEDMIRTHRLENLVKIKQHVPQHELYKLYRNAVGLLLPLFPTLQDEARFPHKLGEYLASGTIVISNPVGEICYYLENARNVLLSEPDNEVKYVECMKWVLDNRQEATKIGQEGQLVGRESFDYKSHSKEISTFLSTI